MLALLKLIISSFLWATDKEEHEEYKSFSTTASGARSKAILSLLTTVDLIVFVSIKGRSSFGKNLGCPNKNFGLFRWEWICRKEPSIWSDWNTFLDEHGITTKFGEELSLIGGWWISTMVFCLNLNSCYNKDSKK